MGAPYRKTKPLESGDGARGMNIAKACSALDKNVKIDLLRQG
jgi:hypothetical protein